MSQLCECMQGCSGAAACMPRWCSTAAWLCRTDRGEHACTLEASLHVRRCCCLHARVAMPLSSIELPLGVPPAVRDASSACMHTQSACLVTRTHVAVERGSGHAYCACILGLHSSRASWSCATAIDSLVKPCLPISRQTARPCMIASTLHGHARLPSN
jgi:hypothetical protein